MSSAFQAHLEGSPINGLQQPLHLAYGSIVTIKSHRLVG
jgi:dolichyl-phosphate-mannose--protein O-mannosyl transferase